MNGKHRNDRSIAGAHAPDGADVQGRKLPIRIRIGPDGRLYVHDITAALIPVLQEICPTDEALAARARAMQLMAMETGPEESA